MKIGAVKAIFFYGRQWISPCTFHIYCPIWEKLGVRDLYIMCLSLYALHENRCWESSTFRLNVIEIQRMHFTVKRSDIFNVKDAFVKSGLCYGVYHLQSWSYVSYRKLRCFPLWEMSIKTITEICSIFRALLRCIECIKGQHVSAIQTAASPSSVVHTFINYRFSFLKISICSISNNVLT